MSENISRLVVHRSRDTDTVETWKCYLPTNILPGVGSRDAYVSKKTQANTVSNYSHYPQIKPERSKGAKDEVKQGRRAQS